MNRRERLAAGLGGIVELPRPSDGLSFDLHALDETREAATLRVVKVDVLNACIGEELADRWRDVSAFAYIGTYDHVI